MKRKKHADEVVAATAGVNNWKTWAGRAKGSDDFEVLDLVRGMKRSLYNRFVAAPPPPGTTCPVCFCESGEWHLTSSCAHAVCLHCFKAYASSQVRDKENHGPLKCPVCPQALRESDAIVALSNDKELLRIWDLKVRNRLLRALPAFRFCPRCSEDSTNESGGGGFVTPSCLSPHYEERHANATSRIRHGLLLTRFIFLGMFLVLALHILRNPSKSISVDILLLLKVFTFLRNPHHSMRYRVALWAREALLKPITVECPCCSFEFILPASLSRPTEDEESKKWMENNARPCPSCSVPISKNGGCNHMRCSHCRATFCWACMRVRSRCAAYNCLNGGVNATLIPTFGEQDPRANDSVSGRIDRILESEPAQWSLQKGIAIALALLVRELEVVGWLTDISSLQKGIAISLAL